MLKIERFIATLFAAVSFTCIASAQYSVRGEVIDSTGTGEPYATIRIYSATDTTRAVTMGVTAENGTFNQALSRAGSYRLSVASVGKQEIKRNFEDRSSLPKSTVLATMWQAMKMPKQAAYSKC